MRIAGSPDIDGGCVWGEYEADGAWVPFSLYWPHGYTARFSIAADGTWTLEILQDGVIRARAGDVVQANTADNEPFGEPRCRVSDQTPTAVFSIDRVLRPAQ
jgi:hypothetical protein